MTPNPAGGIGTIVRGSAGHVVCTRNNWSGDAYCWMQRSLDLGQTWTAPQDTHSGPSYADVLASGDQMFRIFRSYYQGYALDRFSRSTDGGATWSAEVTVDTARLDLAGLVRTRTHLLAVRTMLLGNTTPQIARGYDLGAMWTAYGEIPGLGLDTVLSKNYQIAGDSASETALLVTRSPRYRIYLHRTSDGGEEWEPRELLTIRWCREAAGVRRFSAGAIFGRWHGRAGVRRSIGGSRRTAAGDGMGNSWQSRHWIRTRCFRCAGSFAEIRSDSIAVCWNTTCRLRSGFVRRRDYSPRTPSPT